MKSIITSVLAIATAMAFTSCKTTVADHVPSAAGTPTGSIKVDWLTSVGTVSRIAPVTSGCTSKRASAPTPQQFATTSEGITVTTNRMAPVEGYHHAASGTSDLGGTTLIGGAAWKGKFRSQINNNNNLRNDLRLGGCTDPNSPYIYGY